MKAIVYTSNTGNTKRYAGLLGEDLGLPVYSTAEADKRLSAGDSIIYMGWLKAGFISGYKKANARYDVLAVCAVGMLPASKETLDTIRTQNELSQNTPVFCLPGGFNMDKLHGMKKMLMKLIRSSLRKKITAGKSENLEEDNAMLDSLENGCDLVSESNLKELIVWYHMNK